MLDDGGQNRQAADLPAKQQFLSQLGERSEHGSERQLRASTSVDEARSGHGRFRMPIELGDEAVDRAGSHDGVAVQQQQRRARARPYADVVRARESEIRSRFDDLHSRPSSRCGSAAVARLIVDDDDLVSDRGSRRVERLETAIEVRTRVVADDDDRQVGQKPFTTKDTKDTKNNNTRTLRGTPHSYVVSGFRACEKMRRFTAEDAEFAENP